MGIAYRREIDGLRAIAVGAVVLFHAGVWPRGGFVGVDVFFVISGYLITALLLREHAQTGRIDLLAFYARRVRRIFPAATLVVLATLGLSAVLLPPAALEGVANSAAAAAVFGANLFFRAVTGGYWSADAEAMPLLHLWSLSVEEQFYFLWPALLLAVLRWRPRLLVPGLVGLAIASLAYAEWLLQRDPTAAFYVMPARWWELAVGGLIAASPATGRGRALAWGGLALTVAACAMPLAHFPGIGALPAVAGAGALLWAVHRGQDLGLPGRLLRSAPMVGLGLISYSLYLWHWPLLALYRALSIGPGQTSTRLALCVVALLLAVASYRYVEQPFRRLRAPSVRFVAIGAAASLCLALGACGVSWRTRADIASRADNPLAVRAERDLPPDWRRCHSFATDGPAVKCDPGAAPAVLWGDSMAMAWAPAFPHHAQLSRDACAPVLSDPGPDAYPADRNCALWRHDVIARLTGRAQVVLVARWSVDFAPPRTAAMTAALRQTLTGLATVRQVIILLPTPELPDAVPKCIRADALAACTLTAAQYAEQSAAARRQLTALAGEFPNVTLLDPAPFFCPGGACGPLRGGVPLYWDSHHVTASAARAFGAQISPAVVRVAATGR